MTTNSPHDIPSSEIASIDMLTTKEIKGLFVYARKKLSAFQKNGNLTHLTEEDVVHTALEKTLSGERRWNSGSCTVYGYFLGVISSLISNEGRAKKGCGEWHNTELTEYQSDTVYTDQNDAFGVLSSAEEIHKIMDLVQRKKPKLLPLVRTMYVERTDKPKVLAKLLNKNVETIYSEKKQLLRLCQSIKEGMVK